jgi:radical SAM protein with 4Fe4S-binding SPASM domain
MLDLASWRNRRAQRAEVIAWIDRFVADTRPALHIRSEDSLLMIRPEKTLGINDTGAAILGALYARDGRDARQVLTALSRQLNASPDRLLEDTRALLETVASLMREDFSPRDNLRFEPYERGRVGFPVLAEIALTYACQNRCAFCYAASPDRGEDRTPMTGEQVRRVMDRIWHEAHVPSLSFTGGEATLRPDLPDLIRYGADLGFRVNLITNGVRPGDPDYARVLVGAGLDSAQISIEAADAALHDELVGRVGAHEATVAAVGHFRSMGIHVHTNTTLCRDNVDQAPDLIRFLAREVGTRTLSMNLLIRTGFGLGEAAGPLSYADIAPHLPILQRTAEDEGMTLVWYSPLPYCVVNPVLMGQGAKSCACVDGILSVDPEGNVLPCSSFEQGIGSLLDQSFDEIYGSPAARWWRERRYVPPVCRDCEDVDLCAGACPLYWDAAGSFAEIPRCGSDDAAQHAAWAAQRAEGGSYGVPLRSV